jgi:hypothetical protein
MDRQPVRAYARSSGVPGSLWQFAGDGRLLKVDGARSGV